MASVNELESKIKDLEQSIKSRSGGSAASRRGNDGLLPLGANKYLQNLTQEKINTAKAENNQAALENEQRIYRDLISEQLAQERAIAERQQQLASLQQELELAKSNQAQTNSAAGQTAEQKVNNDTPQAATGEGTPPSAIADPQPVSNSEAAKINASNDPTTGDTRGAESTSRPKSEAASEAGDNSDKTKQQKSDTVKGDSGVSGQKTDSDKDKDKGVLSVPISGIAPSNILHEYSSYTYRISLFFLEKDDYNSLAANPDVFTPKYALMSSGGGYAKKTGEDVKIGDTIYRGIGRHPDFEEDFFIDNLSILTVVGLNSKTKATNAIDISFTITEPHGISLLDRLLSASETSADKSMNYMEQPYLLQVDFLSSPGDPFNNNSKKQDNLITRKRIPIKFLELKINPGTGGTVYQVRAIPYNHVAFNMTVASVPVNFNIEASTVGEFFSTGSDAQDLVNGFREQIAANKERVESELTKWKAERTIISGGVQQEPTPSQIEAERTRLTKSISYDSTSFVGAYNEYMKEVSKQGLSKNPPTLIAFNIPDQSIAKSPIVNKETAQSRDNTMADKDRAVNAADDQFKKKQVFPIHPGTSIIDIVDKIVQKSDYITTQISEFKKQSEESTADANYSGSTNENDRSGTSAKKIDEKFLDLNWFKVIPQVVLSDFDFNRNAYSKVVLYTILPYITANQYHPSFSKSQIKQSAAVRTYNYWYTGENMDIIKADIDFDSTYYTQLTTYRDQVKRGGANRQSSEEAVDITATNRAIRAAILPVATEVSGHNSAAGTMNSAEQPKDHIVADLKKSIYSSQRGDMLNIKLTIIGDPAYIKQDDVYYNPASPDTYNKFLTNTEPNSARPIGEKGQILFDREQVYVKLNFKNVVDINDAIGIVNKQTKLTNGRDTNGTFTGMYKVLKVQSSFVRGQFTQVLDLVRMTTYVDDFDALSVAKSNTSATKKTPDGQPDSVKNNAAADSGSAGGSNTPPATDPKLIAAGNGPATNDPAQSSGAGTPKESSQPSSAAPSNANDSPNAAPQEKAPDPQSDTMVGLDRLTADYDRIYNTPAGITSSTSLEQAKAAGAGLLVISKIEFNNRIAAANLIPDQATKLQELININVDRQVFYEQMFIYTKQTIYDPAQKMDPKPVDFINNVFNASTNGPVKGIDVSLKQINKFYDELKTLDPAAAAESLKNKDKDYAAAKVTAKNRIMG